MPAIHLTNSELRDAARACRAMAYQDEERAKQLENPGVRQTFTDSARQFEELAGKLEKTRAASPADTKLRNFAPKKST